MKVQQGGCLCRQVRFEVDQDPHWVTICYCRFCQKATGSDHMIEPIFARMAFRIVAGEPCVYTHLSEGSRREVYVHFCGTCGSKLYLTFDRWRDRLGVYAGAFDDPNWFPIAPENTKHIFLDEAPRGTVIPAGFRTYAQHAVLLDGTPLDPQVLDAPLTVQR